MQVALQLAALRHIRAPLFLAAGFFDGLHRGHRKVIELTIARALAAGGQAWVLTFGTHPRKVLAPADAPQLLTANRHKLRLLQSMALNGVLLLPFTRRLAGMEPAAFVRLLCRNIPTLAEVFVGDNWRFGRKAAGTPTLLTQLGSTLGFKVRVVHPARLGGAAISSSRIRRHVQRGEFARASALLGRPFSVLGTVVHGLGLGRRLGYPTANLDLHNEVHPPNGVYAVKALIPAGKGKTAKVNGIANLGVRPTFPGSAPNRPTLEIHLFDTRRRLYGADLEVFFVRRLRDERHFDSPDKLCRQIAADTRRARRILHARP
jgi:riboflavin kinase/FMN adenylyltransferase